MGMRLGQTHDEPDVMMDINTTPLIDVMLVLLIMLIITIPAQMHATHMATPQASSSSPPSPPVVVKIDVEANNTIRWNGQTLPDPQALHMRLQEAALAQPQPELHVRAHGKARYDSVAAVMAAAQRHGLNKLGIQEAAPAGH